MEKKRLMACDLDNTLFYSHKHRREGDICLEWLEGMEQSFTPPMAWQDIARLAGQDGFVPVTTRSLAQYSRIEWPQGRQPQLALVANGGLLLRGGVVDEEYQAESRQIAGKALPALQALLEQWLASGIFKTARLVDGLYIFAHAPQMEEAELEDLAVGFRAENAVQAAGLAVQASGHKLYAFPPGLSKGEGLCRLLEELGGRDSVELLAAGDSSIDLPLLALADQALVPEAGLAARLAVPVQVCTEGRLFPEFVARAGCDWLK